MFGLLCLVTFDGNIDCANLSVSMRQTEITLSNITVPIAANKIVGMFIGLVNLKL